MHRIIDCPTCSNSLHGHVSEFGCHVEFHEEFQPCQLTFYEQEILNVFITISFLYLVDYLQPILFVMLSFMKSFNLVN